jgi:hypothetical protein
MTDSQTNTLNEKLVNQVWQVFVVVCMGNCLALLVKCEPVVQKQHDRSATHCRPNFKNWYWSDKYNRNSNAQFVAVGWGTDFKIF